MSAGPHSGARGGMSSAGGGQRHRLHWIGTAASVLLFSASMAVLYIILSKVDPAEIRTAFRSATGTQLAMAGLFTALSYLLLSGYDLLALRQLRARLRYRIVALGA